MRPLKQIETHFTGKPFSRDELNRLGITSVQLSELLKAESVHRLSRGVYVLAGTDLSNETQFQAATMRIDGPSAVCLLSALWYYNLTDHIPKKVWLLVPENKHTAHKDIRLLRSNNPHWKIGIEKHQNFAITNLERTIVESLCMKRILGPQIGIDALKTALKEKKTTLDKVLRMAKSLGVDHRIQNYIEVLA
ncbi:MAG: hypothetical protein JNM39_10595 [Bdellovibrionaceae bacterium]|jgi:predicted transcriptional regulator of viral defense system|nr:hypothetical protein [Pseudobdellovibrionaceae bacterium]